MKFQVVNKKKLIRLLFTIYFTIGVLGFIFIGLWKLKEDIIASTGKRVTARIESGWNDRNVYWGNVRFVLNGPDGPMYCYEKLQIGAGSEGFQPGQSIEVAVRGKNCGSAVAVSSTYNIFAIIIVVITLFLMLWYGVRFFWERINSK